MPVLPVRENFNFQGFFEVFVNPGYSNADLRAIREQGKSILDLPGVLPYEEAHNTVMKQWKLSAAQAVFPNADRLVITNQTTSPADTETSYSGTIYTSVAADEYYRSANTNPAQIGWNITSESANGTWGSLILITTAGIMINRALAGGVIKTSGSNLVVDFTGTVS